MAVQLEAAVLCDYAAEYGGRVAMMGAFTSRVIAAQFPTLHQIYFVGRPAWLDEQEGLQPHVVELAVEDPDAAVVARLVGQAVATGPAGGTDVPSHPQMPTGMNFVLPLTLPLARPGLHVVVFSLDAQARPPPSSRRARFCSGVNTSRHAAERMAQRGISMTDVQQVLAAHVGPPGAGDRGNLVYRAPVGGRTLVVVVSADHSVLVTAYWETS